MKQSEVTSINKQKFLAELGKLLTFMYEEDRQRAMGMYSRMFEEAGDEHALIQALISPTRQAVVVARAYNSNLGRLSLSASTKAAPEDRDENGVPDYVQAIEAVREQAWADLNLPAEAEETEEAPAEAEEAEEAPAEAEETEEAPAEAEETEEAPAEAEEAEEAPAEAEETEEAPAEAEEAEEAPAEAEEAEEASAEDEEAEEAPAEAEEAEETPAEAEPENKTYLDTYAWILFMRGEYAEAAHYMDRVVSPDSTGAALLADPASTSVILEHAADIAWFNGDTGRACYLWDLAVRLGDEDVSAVLLKKSKKRKYLKK